MSTRRGLLTAAAVTAAGVALPAVALATSFAEAHPDAALLALGAALDLAVQKETAAWTSTDGQHDEALADALVEAAIALQKETAVVAAAIEVHQARTLAGVLVKVRALDWCCTWEPLDAERLGCIGAPTTDIRLVLSTLSDLSAIGRAA